MGADTVVWCINKWLDYLENPHKSNECVEREKVVQYAEDCIKDLNNSCFDGVPNRDSIVKTALWRLAHLQYKV